MTATTEKLYDSLLEPFLRSNVPVKTAHRLIQWLKDNHCNFTGVDLCAKGVAKLNAILSVSADGYYDEGVSDVVYAFPDCDVLVRSLPDGKTLTIVSCID